MSLLKIAQEVDELTRDSDVTKRLIGNTTLGAALGSAFGVGKSTKGKGIGYSKTRGVAGAIGGAVAGTGSHIANEIRKNRLNKEEDEE